MALLKDTLASVQTLLWNQVAYQQRYFPFSAVVLDNSYPGMLL